jgi:hypothetical protein
MQMTIVEYSNDIVEVVEKEITVYIADFDTGVGAIPNTVIDAKGDLVVGTAADTVDRLAVGSDGQVLTADSSLAKGVKWANTTSVAASAERRSLTMTGNIVLADTDLKYQFLDPGGADRDVSLPATGTNNHTFYIVNTADAFEKLTVKSGSTVIGTVLRGETQIFVSDESSWYSAQKYRQLWVGGWRPTLTSGCGAPAQIEMSTNKNVYDYAPFDPSTIEYAYANVPMPDDYTGGTVYAKFYWLHPATTTNFGVSWGLQGVSFGDDDALDAAQGTAIYANDTGGTTSDLYISPLTAAITIAGTPAAGKLINWRALRKADDATNDTLAVDAYLIGVMIWYPVG